MTILLVEIYRNKKISTKRKWFKTRVEVTIKSPSNFKALNLKRREGRFFVLKLKIALALHICKCSEMHISGLRRVAKNLRSDVNKELLVCRTKTFNFYHFIKVCKVCQIIYTLIKQPPN